MKYLFAFLPLLAACSAAVTPAALPDSTPPHLGADAVYGYTYQRPDGNRLVSASARLSGGAVLDIDLQGRPAWLAATASGEGSIWVAVLEDGRAQAFQILDRNVQAIDVRPERLPPGMPPLLAIAAGSAHLLTIPDPNVSVLTHPVPLPDGRIAYLTRDGDLVVWDQGEIGRLPLNALPDARILVDERGRMLLLTDPTERYTHGVLGDRLEAASITLVESRPRLAVASTIPIADPAVVEGLSPIWTDLDADGAAEIIVTISSPAAGAQVVVFAENGEPIAAGPAVGQGSRWRHQLAAGAFGPDASIGLLEVLTPHLGKVANYYRMEAAGLLIDASLPGYSSHLIGSRNLDMALATDLDGDGLLELLVPTGDLRALAALGLRGPDLVELFRLDLDGRLSTNLSGLGLSDGSLLVGAGNAAGVVRIWQSVPASGDGD